MSSRGCFIVLEGLDGTGKSSISRKLCELLTARQIPTIYTNGIFSPFDKLREEISNIDNVEVSYFYYLSAMLHASRVITELLKTRWVVCDRYIYSTQAYHLGRGLRTELWLKDIPVVQPDARFYLKVIDEAVRRTRIANRNELKKGDEEVFAPNSLLSRIDHHFQAMGMTIIDNTETTLSETADKIMAHLEPLLRDA